MIGSSEREMGSQPGSERVLFVFDGSPQAELALRLLCSQLRGRPNTEILAINVWCVPSSLALDADCPAEELSRLLLGHRAGEIGCEVGAPVFGQLVRARDAAQAIVVVAYEDEIDRIVLPIRPQRGWKQRRSSRRMVRRVLREAPCPVELVAIPERAGPEGFAPQRHEAEARLLEKMWGF